MQGLVQARNVYLPHPSISPWVEDFVRQLAAFPNATHDDDVDACTQALNKLAWSANAHPSPKLEPSEDQHPGFDYTEKQRQVRQTVTDPTAMFEDDLRPNLYRMPRMAGGGGSRSVGTHIMQSILQHYSG